MRPISAASVAANGINRQIDALERAAADVVEQTTSDNGFEPIDISTEARKSGEGLDATTQGGLEKALVDIRISKYLAVANMKVLDTLNDVERAAEAILR
ncbi:MAG: hypothetical protein ACOY0T_06965 [Myxococcota bacterium]